MIPFAVPRNGELVNLSQIVKIRQHKPGRCHECEISLERNPKVHYEPDELKNKIVHIGGEQSACTVYFSDGSNEIYDGEDSRILNIEVHFLLNTYRQMQQAATSQIVTPDGNGQSRIM